MSDKPVFKIVVDSEPFILWEGTSVGRSMDQGGGTFEIRFVDPSRDIIKAFRPGKSCQVFIDENLLLDGYIDGYTINDGDGHKFMFRGRDRVGDLIDCAATVSGPYEFRNQKLEKVVAAVLKPFGIPLRVAKDVDTGVAFKRLSIMPDETAFQFIEKACRFRAVLPVSDGIGGLILAKPGAYRSAGKLVYGENIKRRTVDVNHQERFSDIVVKGQGAPVDDYSNGKTMAGGKGQTKDAEITRYRPLVIVAEKEGYDLSFKQRAEWEKQNRKAKSAKITITAQGWYAAENELWQLNTLVPVKDPVINIDKDMLIKSISFSRGTATGSETEMELAIPEAYDLPAQKESSGDDMWEGF